MAQDTFRPSAAGVEASVMRMQQEISSGAYNLKAGPARFRLSTTAWMGYNDNFNLSETAPKSDLITSTQLGLDGFWKVTPFNTARFGIRIDRRMYLSNPNYNSTGISAGPDSQIGYDFYVGGTVKVSLQDRFALTQNPTDQAALSNVTNFRQFQNTFTTSALFDLNQMLLVTAYDHGTIRSLGNTFSYTDRDSDTLRASSAWLFSKSTTAGLDGAVTYTYYRQGLHNDATSLSFGPFLEQTVTRHLTLRGGAGSQIIQFAQGGGNGDNSDLNGWYAHLDIDHRLNRFCTQTLSIKHEATLGLQSNYEKGTLARYSFTTQFLNRFSLTLNGFYEEGEESGGIYGQSYQRAGGGAQLGCQLNRHLSLNTGYDFIAKNANIQGYDYRQNQVYLGANYAF
jgi:hypothetical protein